MEVLFNHGRNKKAISYVNAAVFKDTKANIKGN